MPRSNIVAPVVRRWAGQVAASATATLVAAALYATLPRVFVPEAAPLAALTSGGKFAARIAGPGQAPVGDLPATDRAVPPGLAGPSGPLQPFPVAIPIAADGFGPAAGPLAPPRALRLPRRPAARRDMGPAEDASRPAPALVAALPTKTAVSSEAADLKEDYGVPSRIIATSRAAWNATAALGSAALSRVVP